ncbi:MAG: CPBP family intramembrane metalloprotease [Bacteroidales bacterium]|nr:CPBP family intramembrane metalloprotease [Bacteroidales bacterium]
MSNKRHEKTNNVLALIFTVLLAFALWFFLFSPWTKGMVNFWIAISLASLVLSIIALSRRKQIISELKINWQAIVAGIFIAAALWGVFWIGDKISSMMFDFEKSQVASIYSMRDGHSKWLIATLLLLIMGPAEEIFWRGYLQKTLQTIISPNAGFVTSVILYSLAHLWSFNYMLIMAALVAGLVWGAIYRFFPKSLPALIISHSLWDVMVFVVFPI